MKRKKLKKNTKSKKTVYNILIAICLVVFLVSGGVLGYQFYTYYQAGQIRDELKGQIDVSVPESEREKLPLNIKDKFLKLYSMNPEFIGWVQIDGTDIDYPVMQTTDNDKYLKTDFYGKYHRLGTVFADYRAKISEDGNSDNIVVYGHSANNGEFFSPVRKYKSLDYYKEHPIIHFDTLYEEADYVILAAFMVDASDTTETAFAYHDVHDFNTQETYDAFFEEVEKRSYFQTEIPHTIDDRYLTLSTCDYEIKNGRLAVVARKLRPDETEESFAVLSASYQSNPLMPNAWYEKKGKVNPYR